MIVKNTVHFYGVKFLVLHRLDNSNYFMLKFEFRIFIVRSGQESNPVPRKPNPMSQSLCYGIKITHNFKNIKVLHFQEISVVPTQQAKKRTYIHKMNIHQKYFSI